MAFPTGWTRRCAITIPAAQVGSGGVTSFTVLLTEANLPAGIFTDARSDGGDIRFSTDNAGASRLAVDIITFNPGTGKALIRVGTVSLSSVSSNRLYLWYGAASETLPAAGDTYGQYAAYDSSKWLRYWPMQDASGNPVDRTSNAATLTLANVTYGAAGKFGNAIQFATTGSQASTPLNLSARSQVTTEAWLYQASYTNNDALAWEFTPNTNTNSGGFFCDPNSSAPYSGEFSATVRTGVGGYNSASYTRPATGWNLIELNVDLAEPSQEVYLAFNGTLQTPIQRLHTTNNTGNLPSSTLYLMNRGNSTLRNSGRLQDYKILTARTAAERATEYNQTNDPASFASAGAPHAIGTGGIEVVDDTAAYASNGNNVTTDAIDTTGANLLIIGLATYAGSVTTVSDSKGNTWTALTQYGTSDSTVRLYYAENPTVGTGHTFSADEGAKYPAISVLAVKGAATSSVADQQNGGTVVISTTVQPGSVTPTEDNELVVTITCGYSGAPSAIDGGFALSSSVDYHSGQSMAGGLAYLIQGAAAATNPTWTWDASSVIIASIATFRAESTGVSVTADFISVIESLISVQAGAVVNIGNTAMLSADRIVAYESASALNINDVAALESIVNLNKDSIFNIENIQTNELDYVLPFSNVTTVKSTQAALIESVVNVFKDSPINVEVLVNIAKHGILTTEFVNGVLLNGEMPLESRAGILSDYVAIYEYIVNVAHADRQFAFEVLYRLQKDNIIPFSLDGILFTIGDDNTIVVQAIDRTVIVNTLNRTIIINTPNRTITVE